MEGLFLLLATIAPFFIAANTSAHRFEQLERRFNPFAAIAPRPHSQENESRFHFMLRNSLAFLAAAFKFFSVLNILEFAQSRGRGGGEGSTNIFMALLSSASMLLRAELIQGLRYTINQRFFTPFERRPAATVVEIPAEVLEGPVGDGMGDIPMANVVGEHIAIGLDEVDDRGAGIMTPLLH